MGGSKYLKRLAREAIVRSGKAQRSEDTGTKYPTELQRWMSERGRASNRTFTIARAAGARYFELPLCMAVGRSSCGEDRVVIWTHCCVVPITAMDAADQYRAGAPKSEIGARNNHLHTARRAFRFGMDDPCRRNHAATVHVVHKPRPLAREYFRASRPCCNSGTSARHTAWGPTASRY